MPNPTKPSTSKSKQYKPRWAHLRNKAIASQYELAGQKNHALLEREEKRARNGAKFDDEYWATLNAYEDAFVGSRGGRGRTKQTR